MRTLILSNVTLMISALALPLKAVYAQAKDNTRTSKLDAAKPEEFKPEQQARAPSPLEELSSITRHFPALSSSTRRIGRRSSE
jgi:hypothetical protein